MRFRHHSWQFIGLLMGISMATKAWAHPGDGIVVLDHGTIYFADVMRETIWELSSSGALSVEKRDRWTHSLFLARDQTLYYEREVNQGDAWPRSFWKIRPDGKHERLIEPQLDGRQFEGGPFVVDDDKNVYFAYHPRGEKRALIMKRTKQGDVRVLTGLGRGQMFQDGPINQATIRMITAMNLGPRGGAIYFADRHHIRRVTLDGRVQTVASDLLDEKPVDPPHSKGPPTTINRLYGLTVSSDGTIYVAYHAGRRVIRIDPKLKVSTAYSTQRPWAPVGATVNEDALFVLETGFEPGSETPGPRVQRMDLSSGAISTLVEVTE